MIKIIGLEIRKTHKNRLIKNPTILKLGKSYIYDENVNKLQTILSQKSVTQTNC